MVNRNRERLVVIQICIDTDGKYSIDGPIPNDTAKIKLGTSWHGDGAAGPTAVAAGAAMRRYHEYFKESARKTYDNNGKPVIKLVTP